MSLVKCTIPQYWTLKIQLVLECAGPSCLDSVFTKKVWIGRSLGLLPTWYTIILWFPTGTKKTCALVQFCYLNEKSRLPGHCNKTKSNLIIHLLNTDASNEGYSVLIQIIFLIPIRLFIKRKLMKRNGHFSGKEPDCQHTPRWEHTAKMKLVEYYSLLVKVSTNLLCPQ